MILTLFLAICLSTQQASAPRNTYFGSYVACPGDCDGDGRDDIAISSPPWDPIRRSFVYLISSRDLKLIRRLEGPSTYGSWGGEMHVLGDVDADSRSDFVLADVSHQNGRGTIELISGSTGRGIYRIDGTHERSFLGAHCASFRDIDGDGIRDYGLSRRGPDLAAHLVLASGKTGKVMTERAMPPWTAFCSTSLAIVASSEGPRVAVGSMLFRRPEPGSVTILSSAGSVLILAPIGRESFARAITAVDDVDDDGIEDFLVSGGEGKACYYVILSSGSHQILRTGVSQFDDEDDFAWSVARLSRRPDAGALVAVGCPNQWGRFMTRGRVLVQSVSTGKTLWAIVGRDMAFLGMSLAEVGDVDGDGVRDIMVGGGSPTNMPPFSEGYAALVSGRNGKLIKEFSEAEFQAR